MIKSPLTLETVGVKLVKEFQAEEVIKSYQNMGIDVNRFLVNKRISLFECKNTGYRFFYPFELIGDDLFYEDISKKRPSYYSDRWEHDKALDFIDETDKVLEIGSGFGAFLVKLNERKIFSKGLELNQYAIEQCRVQNLKVENRLIEEESKFKPEFYDVVCSFQVLEHITEVYEFLKAAVDSIKVGGKLIVGVPNNNPYLFKNDINHTLNLPPHHAGLWNEKALKSLQYIYQIKVDKIVYEPLKYSYSGFLASQINNSSFLKKNVLRLINRFTPRLLKKIYCKFYNGRNILIVFIKK